MGVLKKIWNFCGSWTGTVIIVLFVIFFVAQAFVIPSGSMKNSLLPGDFLFVKKYSYGIPTPHIPWLEKPILPDFKGNGHLIEGKRPARGDIVVFRYPKDTKIHYVKRNFAVGGDEVIFDLNNFYLRPHEGDEFIEKNYDKSDIIVLMGQKFVKEPYKFKGINYNPSSQIGMLANVEKSLLGDSFAMKPIVISELGDTFKMKNLEFNAFYIKVPQDEFFMIGDNRNNSLDSRFWGSVPYKLIVGKPWFVYFSWSVPENDRLPDFKNDRKIRWERIGRFADTLETDESLIYEQD